MEQPAQSFVLGRSLEEDVQNCLAGIPGCLTVRQVASWYLFFVRFEELDHIESDRLKAMKNDDYPKWVKYYYMAWFKFQERIPGIMIRISEMLGTMMKYTNMLEYEIPVLYG